MDLRLAPLAIASGSDSRDANGGIEFLPPFLFAPAGTKLYVQTMKRLSILSAMILLGCLCNTGLAQQKKSNASTTARKIPTDVLVQIVRAEDERRWDEKLAALLANANAGVRNRVALAAGRIGDERAVPLLADILFTDGDSGVRQMAAFALGEIESPAGVYALVTVLQKPDSPARARAVEALGKIAAVLVPPGPPSTDPNAVSDERLEGSRKAILDALKFEAARRPKYDRLTILLGLTALLRARPERAGPVLVQFLSYDDPRIVADTLNTMGRLRLKDNNEQVRQLLSQHPDPIVRANAGRVAGVAEDKGAFDALLDRALHDSDLRVRVSAIRALGTLKDPRAAQEWLQLAGRLPRNGAHVTVDGVDRTDWNVSETLEVATAMGRILQGTDHAEAVSWLRDRRTKFGSAPEFELALVRISPNQYLAELGTEAAARRKAQETILLNWKAAANLAQGLGEIAALSPEVKGKFSSRAEAILRAMIDYRNSGLTINTLVAVHSEYAIPAVMQALAAFKPKDLGEVARGQLRESDVVIRATAAELLGQLPPDITNERALISALPAALADKELNDAALAVLEALGKQKSAAANEAIKTALNSSDHLLRRKAVEVLKANGAGDFSNRIGTVKTGNTEADCRRAIARIGKKVQATVQTSRGAFTIEFLPEGAPLTVDNFVKLARKGFFNGQTVPRVVPNFVVQAGDPRGDQNGGPGYQIRCELNMVPYDRAAVGMALSGKDTGGSQWFVTHSPQPHLDGGYTVFGRVVSGMDVVDKIARGDRIQRIIVSERR